jgi:hypothetical protein
MIISSQVHIDGVTKELSGILGGVEASILVIDSPYIPKIPIHSSMVLFPEGEVSVLALFSASKKLARYMAEYILWLYSIYVHDNELTDLDDQSILDFFEDSVDTDPDFKYGTVSKHFSMTSGVMKDGKLVVKSLETLKRLIYVLRLSLVRGKARILSYYTRADIDNFYLDVADFDQYPLQVILEGDNSVNKWIVEKQTRNVMSNQVIPDITTPYFFMNAKISHQVYLAHNVTTIEEAIDVSTTWNREGFNTSTPSKLLEGERPAITVYSYISSTDITEYKFPGIATAQEILMIGYKKDGEPLYTSLLPL